jgi:hypothetical protein
MTMQAVLAWYATQSFLRMAIIRWLPFGSGTALDVALIGAQQTLLVNAARRD